MSAGQRSWGLPGPFQHRLTLPASRVGLALPAGRPLLAAGNGRSYGDVGLNEGHDLVAMRGLDRYLGFDADSGVLECEAGTLLSDIVRDFLPRGWFPAVVPGTRFVTVGGAIANDVHGKNHHAAGSFGDHVLGLRLLCSDGAFDCSPTHHSALFRATLGGLGLTGLIVTARLRLMPVDSGWMSVRSTRFATLAEFFALNAERERQFPYTVSWIDCLSARDGALRGVYLAGRHAGRDELAGRPTLPPAPRSRGVPFTPPVSLINRLSLRAFNAAYYARSRDAEGAIQSVYEYFWPLDGLLEWNRIYGRRGFYQYQCVLPPAAGPAATQALLDSIARSGQGSFLAVLKTFGDRSAPGLLSFARPGVTLALDFPNLGASTLDLFRRLDAQVLAAGGALYPAKDAAMSPAMFAAGYGARLEAFAPWRDKAFSSSFWRRVMPAETA
ncbi:FAD-binding oxidoreductase [Derxia lacustris]|uniref:FAD-binding oxidoreductase n=1 Tax=Derxia lacustris TaxID=764842 RepID=UPI000A1743E0|nr:FAD-binding oxidoreductase [Derxia lacustris]